MSILFLDFLVFFTSTTEEDDELETDGLRLVDFFIGDDLVFFM